MERGPSTICPDGEASAVSIAWEEWPEEFEAFADSKGIFQTCTGSPLIRIRFNSIQGRVTTIQLF